MYEYNESVIDTASSAVDNQSEVITTYLEVEKIFPHKFGDFGGAMSWPIPLTTAQQKEVLQVTSLYLDSLDRISTPGAGVLDYLNSENPLSDAALRDPSSALATLITGSRGQALGQAIQTRLNAIATDVSISEYTMAGIHLSLHQGEIDRPTRTTIAGFDLLDEKLWGKPASAVFDHLVDYLTNARLSSSRLAGLAANLLLARKAPECLIEKLPDSLKYGSAAWVNLTVAARTIEVHTPGKVPQMTFAQVMASADSAAMIDPQVAPPVHAAALADWGVIKGVIKKNHEEHYTLDELDKVKTQFNQQLTDRLNISILLNSELPNRKAIALTRLKATFKGDVPFEERLLEQPAADPSGLYPTLNGRYSLLDIVMMGGPPYYRWTTRDPRLRPLLGEINTPLELGVKDIFQTQFDSALSNIKEGARLSVKHLVAELPLKDRKSLEYGNVSFYQHKTYRLNLDFFGKKLESTRSALTMKVEWDGVTKLYEIDLKRSVIESKPYDPAEPVKRVNPLVPSLIYTIEPMDLTDKSKAGKLSPLPVNDSLPLNSYSSERTELIAQAFVQHLDLDNEDILQAAKGQTTQEREDAVTQKVIDFVVDLVPFKSAITNFIKGNYFDGAVDLFFDALGFITAGASTAAKLTQVVGRTASAISRGLRAARIIGAFVIGELNPFSGLPALAVAGSKLLGKGLGLVGALAVRQLDKLRNAPDGFKFLHSVGQQHGPTLIGTFKVGERTIDSVGVLKNDNWYQYNINTNQLYGPPREFMARGLSWGGTLGSEANSRVYVGFYHNIEFAKNPRNIADFNHGYLEGRLLDISGYRPRMKFDDLIDLASEPGLTPTEIGALTKELKTRMIQDAKYSSALLVQDVKGVNVKVTAYSQGHYLAHVNMVSKGQCAGLSNAMALAILKGNEDKLIDNLSKAAKMPYSPDATKFISNLEQFHNTVNNKYTFHMGAPLTKMDADEIIEALETSANSKILRLTSKDHAMLAAIRVRNGKPEWLFYEPNSGLVKFATPEAMKEGLHKALESGALSVTLNTYGSKRAGRDFNVSEFHPADIDNGSISRNRVEDLSSFELPDPDVLIAVNVVA
ncbi:MULTISPECIES: hypothetical protein [unclassified Pseudomonas]|uniref:hypothetical protein n=1 Tax=unclassified Pseudomonas TaxID=196821 RepID=UPI0028934227|nr:MULTISPECIES: hypothetical protein [unclassified Pseudomonas]